SAFPALSLHDALPISVVGDFDGDQVRAGSLRFGGRPGQYAAVGIQADTSRCVDQAVGQRVGRQVGVAGRVRYDQRAQLVNRLVSWEGETSELQSRLDI